MNSFRAFFLIESIFFIKKVHFSTPKRGVFSLCLGNNTYLCAQIQFMRTKKAFLALVLTWVGTMTAVGQTESTSVFNFLNLPTSAHAMALGGTNVSLPDDDASLLFQNPALMSNVSDRSMSFSFLTYMQGCKVGNASWVKAHGERGSWGIGAQFVGYGSMREINIEGVEQGEFSALDMAISGGYSYTLTERLSGGAMGKFIYSKYGSYTSIALAVDLGVNYWSEEDGLYVSLVAANIGGQVKRFGETREHLPMDIRLGFTKELENAPIRFSVTFVDLLRWKSKDYYSATGEVSGGRIFTNHLVLGVDILPTDVFYVSAGYSFRRAYELKAAGAAHGAGLTLGGGMHLNKFSLGIAYAKYHVAMPAFMLNAQYHF